LAAEKKMKFFKFDPSRFTDEQLMKHIHEMICPLEPRCAEIQALENEKECLEEQKLPKNHNRKPKKPRSEEAEIAHQLKEAQNKERQVRVKDINTALTKLKHVIYDAGKVEFFIVNSMIKNAPKIDMIKTLSTTDLEYVHKDGSIVKHKFGFRHLDIVDFYKCINDCNQLDFGIAHKDVQVIFHNGSKFDLMFIMNFVAQPQYRKFFEVSDICQSNGAIITMTLNRHIKFIDSCKITSMSLDDLAKTYITTDDYGIITKLSGGHVRFDQNGIRKDLFPYEILHGSSREEVFQRLQNPMTKAEFYSYFTDHSKYIEKKKLQCFLKHQSLPERNVADSEVTKMINDATDFDETIVPMHILHAYCQNDVVLLYKGFENFRKSIWNATVETGKGIDVLKKLTLPAIAFQNWIDNLDQCFTPEKNPELFAKTMKTDKSYFQGLPKLLNQAQFEFIRESTLGGLCCNYTTMEVDCSKTKEKIQKVDVCSEYPASVIKTRLLDDFKGFPMPENDGKFKEVEFRAPVTVNSEFFNKYPHGFMDVEYNDPREPYFDGNGSVGGLSLCQRHELTGRLTHFMEGRAKYPSNMVRYAMSQGVQFKCHKMLYSKTCIEPFNVFIKTWTTRKNDWDLKLDEAKNKLKQTQDETQKSKLKKDIKEANVQREICKLFVNSLIGKMGQKIEKSQMLPVSHENDLFALASSGIFSIHDFDSTVQSWNENYSILKITDRNFESQTQSSKNLQYLASFAMGYSKKIILDGLRQCITLGAKPLYIDTDSISFVGDENMMKQFLDTKGRLPHLKTKELGTFEPDFGSDYFGKDICHYTKFISMGPKKVVYETKDTMKCRFGGLQMNLNQDINIADRVRRELYRDETDTEDVWYANSFMMGESHGTRFNMKATNGFKLMSYKPKDAKLKNIVHPDNKILLEIYQSPEEYTEHCLSTTETITQIKKRIRPVLEESERCEELFDDDEEELERERIAKRQKQIEEQRQLEAELLRQAKLEEEEEFDELGLSDENVYQSQLQQKQSTVTSTYKSHTDYEDDEFI
jgi:hypothetical protein